MAGKADIVDNVAGSVDGITKKQAAEATEAVFESIADALTDGDRVQIPGFGTFQLSHRAARQGRNPQTGAAMPIAASTGVRFKAAKALKDAVNE
jgi:DNA-binding protein HU-beta